MVVSLATLSTVEHRVKRDILLNWMGGILMAIGVAAHLHSLHERLYVAQLPAPAGAPATVLVTTPATTPARAPLATLDATPDARPDTTLVAAPDMTPGPAPVPLIAASAAEPPVPVAVATSLPGWPTPPGTVTPGVTTIAYRAEPLPAWPTPPRISTPGVTARSTVQTPTPATPEPEPFVVMIDPGHGGTDPGSKAPNGLLEKDLTLDIAQRVSTFLGEVPGMQVLATRHDDTGLSRQSRVDAIRGSGADMVVSLHFNHLPQTDVTLVESFYADRENILESRALQRAAGSTLHTGDSEIDLDFTEGSARLAHLMQNHVFNAVQTARPDAIDAGVKEDTLFVLTRSFVAGTLIELTCISNVDEAERLTSEDYRNELAAGIADAVRDYRESLHERPLGGVES